MVVLLPRYGFHSMPFSREKAGDRVVGMDRERGGKGA